MKQIRIPARTIDEEVSPITSLVVNFSRGGIVYIDVNGESFERQLTPSELDSVVALIEPTIVASLPDARVEDAPGPEAPLLDEGV